MSAFLRIGDRLIPRVVGALCIAFSAVLTVHGRDAFSAVLAVLFFTVGFALLLGWAER